MSSVAVVLWLLSAPAMGYPNDMNGVTTAIVLFIFAALAFPRLVKNRPQFYMAIVLTLGIILIDALAHAVGSNGFTAVAYFLAGILQIVTVILIVLSAGGLSPRELGGELSGAYEVLRRGETEKETIIPLSAAALKKDQAEAPAESPPTSPSPASAPPPHPPRKADTGPLPLE